MRRVAALVILIISIGAATPTNAELTSLSNAGIWTAYSGDAGGTKTCTVRGSVRVLAGGIWHHANLTLRAIRSDPATIEMAVENSQWAFAAGRPIRLTLQFNPGGTQQLHGVAKGTAIQAYLISEQLVPWLHGFTAGRKLSVRQNDDEASVVSFPLSGTARAVNAMGDCIQAAGFIRPPKPFVQAGLAPEALASSAKPLAANMHSALHGSTESHASSSAGLSTAEIFFFVALLGFLTWIYTVWYAANIEGENLARAIGLSVTEIRAQAHSLRIRRVQTVAKDIYGTTNTSKWEKEKAHFIERRIQPFLVTASLDRYLPKIMADLQQEIETASQSLPVDRSKTARYASDPFVYDPRMTPVDYEHHCAILLSNNGWNTSTTAITGDQGADVLATRKGVRLVLQCKLYGKSVGNKAVQEAFAAKNFQGCDVAAVVSNASYTSSARRIAATTGVYLLHHDQLETFNPGPALTGARVRVS